MSRQPGALLDAFNRFANYRPPDPEAEGLTPLQVAERTASRRRAFLLYMETQMTPELARIVIRSCYAELRCKLDITDEQAVDLWNLAKRVYAETKEWARHKRISAPLEAAADA